MTTKCSHVCAIGACVNDACVNDACVNAACVNDACVNDACANDAYDEIIRCPSIHKKYTIKTPSESATECMHWLHDISKPYLCT